MADPKISWQVLERINENDEEYIPTRNYTEDDSYTSGQYVQKRFRVWNNYYGSTDVDDALDCKLILAFKNYEDNFLLHLINIKVNEGDWVVPNIDTDRGVVDIKDLASGIIKSFKVNPKETWQTIKPIIKWAYQHNDQAMLTFFQMIMKNAGVQAPTTIS